jgi:hypothetical protein
LECQSYKKYRAKSADFLIDKFKEEAVLKVWQSESEVFKNWSHSQRECLQMRGVERIVECATWSKRKYGFESDCAVLWGIF